MLTSNTHARSMAEKLIERLTRAPALATPYSDPDWGLEGVDFKIDFSSTLPRSVTLVWRPES